MAWDMPHIFYCLGFTANLTPVALRGGSTSACAALSPSSPSAKSEMKKQKMASRYHVQTTKYVSVRGSRAKSERWFCSSATTCSEVGSVLCGYRTHMADAYTMNRLAVDDTPASVTRRDVTNFLDAQDCIRRDLNVCVVAYPLSLPSLSQNGSHKIHRHTDTIALQWQRKLQQHKVVGAIDIITAAKKDSGTYVPTLPRQRNQQPH